MKNISSLAFFVILFLGLGIVALMALPDGVTGGLRPALALVGGAAASSEMAAAQEPADVQAVSGGNANWVALPLENPALTMASELKTEMENGSGVTVGAVQEWDSASQSYLTYESNPGDDFALQTGGRLSRHRGRWRHRCRLEFGGRRARSGRFFLPVGRDERQ